MESVGVGVGTAATEARDYLNSRKRQQYSPVIQNKPRTPAAAIGGPLASGAASRYSQVATQPHSSLVGVADGVGTAGPPAIATGSATASKQARSLFPNPLNRLDYTSPQQAAYEAELAKGVASKKSAINAARDVASQQLTGAIGRLGSNSYEQEGAAMAANDLARSAARSAGGYSTGGGVMRRGVYATMPSMADAGGRNLATGAQQRTTAMLAEYGQKQRAAQAARQAAYDKQEIDRLTGNAPGLNDVDPNVTMMADNYGLQGDQREAFIKTQMERMNAGRYRYGISEQDMKRAQPISPMNLLDRRMDATDEQTAAAKQAMMAGRVATGRPLPAGFVADMSPGSPAAREMAVRQERMNRAGQRRAAEEARAAAMAQNAQMQGLINASLAGNPNASRILDTMAAQGDRNAQLAMEAAAMQQRAAADNRRIGLQEQEMKLLDERQRMELENEKVRNQAYSDLSAAEAAKLRAEAGGGLFPIFDSQDTFRKQLGDGIPPDQAAANTRSFEATNRLYSLMNAGNSQAGNIIRMRATAEEPDASGLVRTADFFKRFYEVASNGSPIEAEALDMDSLRLGFEKEGIQRQHALEYYKTLEEARGETMAPRLHPANPPTKETQGLGYLAGTSMKNTLRMDNEMRTLAQLFGFVYKPMRPTTAEEVRELQNYRDEIDARSWMPQTF